jgi:hypothetical protein
LATPAVTPANEMAMASARAKSFDIVDLHL